MTSHKPISRRSLLRKGAVATGAVVFGGTTVVGSSVAHDEQAGVVAQIEGHGHYAWFPLGRESWGRSTTPYDMQDGDSRWLAQPQSDGSVRCLAQNLGTEPPNRNTGFDVHLGRLGTIETVAVTSRTLRTPRWGPAELFFGLYLDKDDSGEFGNWEPNDDGTESALGSETDDEGLLFLPASGEVTIDGDTVFRLINAGTEATLTELQEGTVEGISGETLTALYIGVINGGEGTDEVVIEDMRVSRS